MFFFFFFQAEDGIRDWSVTGVQTCALPISRPVRTRLALWDVEGRARPHGPRCRTAQRVLEAQRSEERRVGKEWRSRWWQGHVEERIKNNEDSRTGTDK